jgi:signal transduction histidine kinase
MRSAGPLLVSADPVLLAQALSNLIDNALKYAPQRGSIEVAVQRLDPLRAEISVSDNGPGIEDEEKTKVMQRFYRGDASRGTPGVGLGLSLVQAVAKLHGSALELRDNGPGLQVAMSIPLDLAGAAARETQPELSSPGAPVATPTLASLP